VRVFLVHVPVKQIGWLSLLLLLIGLAGACSRQNAQAAPDPVTILSAIASADSATFPSSQAGNKHWSNPYLVVRPQTVGLLSDATANEERILKPEEVLPALAGLPKSAWPYGRAVAVLLDEKSAGSEQEKIAIRRTRGIVVGELQGAQVAINWVPVPSS
jgi:hypothetical protein